MHITDRVKNIITNPKTEWLVIESESPNIAQLLQGYVVPLSIAMAIASFIGFGFIGMSFYGIRVASLASGLAHGILYLVVSILCIYITAYVVDALAPQFSSEKHLGRSLQLVVYGGTPLMVAGLFSLIPSIAELVLIIGALYSVYVSYLGLTPMKRTPEDKKVVYLAVIYLLMLVIFSVTGAIVSLILRPFFGIAFGGFGYYGL